MFKDYNKYLSTSLKVYLFVLVCVLIMKLVGLDYFGLDISNPIMLKIEVFLEKHWIIRDIIYLIPLVLTQYVILTISSNDNSKKTIIYNTLLIPIYYLFESYKIKFFGTFSIVAEEIYFLVIVLVYNKKLNKHILKRFVNLTLILFLLQVISTFTRFRYSIVYVDSIIANLLLNLDYIISLIIIYKMHFKKGDCKLCYQVDQYSFLQMKANLKNLLKRLQKNLLNFKAKPKKIKTAILIYLFLSLIWNTLSVVVILFIAKLNNTFIECIFILSSFWLSKRTFGKAFHLSSMAQCFIVSNITYYILNRITTPLGISIIVPIMLGVGLSYVTSKFTKKLYKPLYRGMPKDLFDESILKVEDKNSIKYNICYEYYIEKKIAINLSMKYNYSEAGIRKILKNVNKKIKELNK